MMRLVENFRCICVRATQHKMFRHFVGVTSCPIGGKIRSAVIKQIRYACIVRCGQAKGTSGPGPLFPADTLAKPNRVHWTPYMAQQHHRRGAMVRRPYAFGSSKQHWNTADSEP
jgi:hypothetical protein